MAEYDPICDAPDFQFYAHVAISEWGEPDRERRIGPYTITADTPDNAADELWDNLARAGEDVLRIEPA